MDDPRPDRPTSGPPPIPPPPPAPLTGKQTYNVVSDTVTGVNVRAGDNVMQLVAAVIGLVAGATIGYFVAREPIFGASVGGLLGMIGGVFLTGIYLMIYRGVRHAKGRHD